MFSERDDEQKDPRALSNALAHFHRYGSESRYLKRPTDADLNASTTESLSSLIDDLLAVDRTVLYFGPRTIEEVEEVFLKSFIGKTPTLDTPSITPDRSLKASENQVFFLQKRNGTGPS